MEQSLAATRSSNVYRHLSNQVLDNLEADFVETYISLC